MSANDCLGCVHAEWKLDKKGNLHRSREGKCLFKWEAPPLPNSRYFIGGMPWPCGGRIERGHVFRNECPHFRVAT